MKATCENGSTESGGHGTDQPPARAERVVHALADLGLTIACAESLTGGRLVARLIDVPGASRCVLGGIVAYVFSAKSSLLGVDPDFLSREGAVNEETAAQMARGARERYGADLALSTTGVAGPGPDHYGVPQGRVVLGIARSDGAVVTRVLDLAGGRDAVRDQTVDAAIGMLDALLPDGAV